MTTRTRTLLGVLLFVPLAAILLTTFACLPAPVGDPDTSKLDPKLTGAWESSKDKENEDPIVALIRPWDKHTYYIQYINRKKDNPGVMNMKAWLTPIGNATFLTAEPLDRLDFAFGPDEDAKPYWIVGRIKIENDTLTYRVVKSDSWIVKELATREKLEAAIKAQIDNDELYGETLTLKRIKKEDKKSIEELLKSLHIGEGK